MGTNHSICSARQYFLAPKYWDGVFLLKKGKIIAKINSQVTRALLFHLWTIDYSDESSCEGDLECGKVYAISIGDSHHFADPKDSC